MQNTTNTLGIDFGTSNSAAGICVNGQPFLIELEAGEQTLPTSVFFDFDTRKTTFGTPANRALINGSDGRYMRSLKSVLGTSIMHEPRRMMGETITFVDIIARFLKALKTRAEETCHTEFPYALSGRPVHFHSNDAQRDVQALRDLQQCYERAGFRDVTFLNEPEAAALAAGPLPDKSLNLIVDIGGGTSDFTVFRTHGEDTEIIASYGVRIGGTNFDKSISFDHIMPLFGRGTQIRKELGAELLTAPNALFQDLATWEKIPFLYTAETRRNVEQLIRVGVDPHLFERLQTILTDELGHDLAFTIERAKIETNKAERDATPIDLGLIERGLTATLNGENLSASLHDHAKAIGETATETLRMAQLETDQIDTIIFVGGSSLMSAVQSELTARFPNATQKHQSAFTGIVEGLALASAHTA
ncbi:MAG: Hsp70 family protein [Amylibacter sp.]|jgi:hypothetical chaperone protein|nr:Hsp70 family protein [Amylibacter sp.]